MSSPHKRILTPAYVLHHRPFTNSSLIVTLFVLNTGKVTCVARGVKKKGSRLAAIVQPFIPLMVTFAGRGEMKTLYQCEAAGSLCDFPGQRIFAAYYVNELVLKFLNDGDSSESLFAAYTAVLADLQDNKNNMEQLLRQFELLVLAEQGYGMDLLFDSVNQEPVRPEKTYAFRFETGPVELETGPGLTGGLPVVSGDSLVALSQNSLLEKHHFQESKKLMRYLISQVLGGYQFKSRDFFK